MGNEFQFVVHFGIRPRPAARAGLDQTATVVRLDRPCSRVHRALSLIRISSLEAVAGKAGDTVGGLLNATRGNL